MHVENNLNFKDNFSKYGLFKMICYLSITILLGRKIINIILLFLCKLKRIENER